MTVKKSSSSRQSSKDGKSTRSAKRSCSRESSGSQIMLSSNNLQLKTPSITVMKLDEADGNLCTVFLDCLNQLMQVKEA